MWGYRLATVSLVDAHLCTDPGKYLSALLLSLSSMLHLELPHVSVLSKADMVEAYGELPFNLEYFTEVWSYVMSIEVSAHLSGGSKYELCIARKPPPVAAEVIAEPMCRDCSHLQRCSHCSTAMSYVEWLAVCIHYATDVQPLRDAQVQDLSRLIEAMGQDPFAKRYRRLSAAVADIIEDFGLVAFQALAIEDKDSVEKVLTLADKATGYVFAGLAGRNPYPMELKYGPVAVDSGVGGLWDKHQRDQDVTISERET